MGQFIAVVLIFLVLWLLLRREQQRLLPRDLHELSDEELAEMLSTPEWYR